MQNNQISDLVFYTQVSIEESMGLVKHQASLVEVYGNNLPVMNVNVVPVSVAHPQVSSYQRSRTKRSSSSRCRTGIKNVSRSK